jgi:hypothetical protein
MSASISDNGIPADRSTPGCHAHPEHPTVERYSDGQRWTEHRFASGVDGASPHTRPETSAVLGRDPQEFAAAASAGWPSRAQGEVIGGPRA